MEIAREVLNGPVNDAANGGGRSVTNDGITGPWCTMVNGGKAVAMPDEADRCLISVPCWSVGRHRLLDAEAPFSTSGRHKVLRKSAHRSRCSRAGRWYAVRWSVPSPER